MKAQTSLWAPFSWHTVQMVQMPMHDSHELAKFHCVCRRFHGAHGAFSQAYAPCITKVTMLTLGMDVVPLLSTPNIS